MSSLRRSAAISLAGLLINATHALAAEKVGEAVLIKTAVLGGNRPLVVKAPVHRDERIRTSNTGLGQFVFRDGTKLAVGWGSSVVIDKYVFDELELGQEAFDPCRERHLPLDQRKVKVLRI